MCFDIKNEAEQVGIIYINLNIVYYILLFGVMEQVLDSIVASIPACHAGDPGSIPGRGAFFSSPAPIPDLGGNYYYTVLPLLQILCTNTKKPPVRDQSGQGYALFNARQVFTVSQ